MDQRKKSYLFLLLALVLLGVIPLIWPGDTTWINDEPQLMSMALQHKNAGTIASHGLMGSRGVVYGPLPTWIYTAMLHFSSDLVELARLRALLVTSLTILSIAWLASICQGLRPAVGCLALLSPYLWVYSRQLWDNSFLIPFSSLTLTVYISFCVRPTRWKLWLTTLGIVAMFLTHLMSVVMIVPMFLHALYFHRRWLRENMAAAFVSCAMVVALSWSYVAHSLLHPVSPHPPMGVFSFWQGWIFPFFGGQFFSAYGIEYFFGGKWFSSDSFRSTEWILMFGVFSWIALPVGWMGMILVGHHLWKKFRESSAQDADFHMGLLSLLALACQCVLNGFMRIYDHPHYFNATWFCFFYFFWRGLSLVMAVPSFRIGRWLAPAQAGAMVVILVYLVLNIHYSGGNREIHYGPTLKHQIDIARQINAYHPESSLHSNHNAYLLFPHALSTIERCYGLRGTDTGPKRNLSVRPSGEKERLGWVAVSEIPDE